MIDFCKKKLSEAAETFRIDATGELTNVAEYEHDPTSLSGVPTPKSQYFDILEVLANFLTLFGTLRAPSARDPPVRK